jgi:hypothetical protein
MGICVAAIGSCVESDTKSDVSEETSSRPWDKAVEAVPAMSHILPVAIFVWVFA